MVFNSLGADTHTHIQTFSRKRFQETRRVPGLKSALVLYEMANSLIVTASKHDRNFTAKDL